MDKNANIKNFIDMEEEKKEELDVEKEEKKGIEGKLGNAMQRTSRVHTKKDFKKIEKMPEKIIKEDIKQIKKLKCNYQLFKDERSKNKMQVPNRCELCNKNFNNNDNIYVALNKQSTQIFICEGCAQDNIKRQ